MSEYILKRANIKKLVLFGIGTLLMLVIIGATIIMNSENTLILDVNPSIEIKTNGLKKVVEINGLNKDAKELLKEYKLENDEIEDVVEDLIDLMILNGYITGGEDNLVMITVDDENADKQMLDKVNGAIAAYLENRQLEAAVMSQTIDLDDDDYNTAKEKDISPGKLKIIEKVMDNDKNLTYEELDSVTLKDLVLILEKLDVDFEDLFDKPNTTISVGAIEQSPKEDNKRSTKNEIISAEEAIAIGLELADGQIIEFELELDKDNGRLIYEIEIEVGNKEHEIKIDAYTSNVLKHEIDKDGDMSKKHKLTKQEIISAEKAIAIGLKQANGKITKFELELDEDDGRLEYEIEIKLNGVEYEIEIDAYSGKVLNHEIDDD